MGSHLRRVAAIILMLGIWISGVNPVWAAEGGTDSAPALFAVHCAGCHPHGGNIVRRGKTLKQRALKRYGMDSVAAIATVITQGKGIMSAYGDRLSPDEIDLLAQFVWDNAQRNWRNAE